MKLSRGDKTIGISFYAEGSEKPLSITLDAPEDHASHAEAQLVGLGLEWLTGEKREKRLAELDEFHSRPRRYQPQVTIGLGLDRETTTISRDDFEALVEVIDAVRDAIKTRDVEVERYERERKAKKVAE